MFFEIQSALHFINRFGGAVIIGVVIFIIVGLRLIWILVEYIGRRD